MKRTLTNEPSRQVTQPMKILHSLSAGLLSSPSMLRRQVAFPLFLLGTGLLLVQPCAADSGGFNGTGSLITARNTHTATLLPNGKVLVAGGFNIAGNTTVASAELYDPASGTWTATGSLVTARYLHTADLAVQRPSAHRGRIWQRQISQARNSMIRRAALGRRPAASLLAHYFHTATLLPTARCW